MSAIASRITSLTTVYLIVYSRADQRKHQSSASLAFVWGIHRDGEFPAQGASYAENGSIWWRHHVLCLWVVSMKYALNCYHHCYLFQSLKYVIFGSPQSYKSKNKSIQLLYIIGFINGLLFACLHWFVLPDGFEIVFLSVFHSYMPQVSYVGFNIDIYEVCCCAWQDHK